MENTFCAARGCGAPSPSTCSPSPSEGCDMAMSISCLSRRCPHRAPGQSCPCTWAIAISAWLKKTKPKEASGFHPGAKREHSGLVASSQPPGWGYLHTVREHLASPLLLLLENGVLVAAFPPPGAFSIGQSFHGCCLAQADH